MRLNLPLHCHHQNDSLDGVAGGKREGGGGGGGGGGRGGRGVDETKSIATLSPPE